MAMNDFAKARRYMVDCQVRTADVTDHAVIAAFDAVERERFAPAAARDIAYLDRALDVGEGRAMLPPMLLARLVQLLKLTKSDRVIDLGCALGYSTAILADIAGEAIGIEASGALAGEAAARLAAAGVANATAATGSFLDPALAGKPADAMLVNGAFEIIPDGWIKALADGGRIAGVQMSGGVGRAALLTRAGDELTVQSLFDAAAPVLPDLRRKAEFAF